jgi:hypothetical protein
MQQNANEDDTRKAAGAAPTRARNLAPGWKRLPIGWIVLGLVAVSWVAFLLMTNGIAFFIHH